MSKSKIEWTDRTWNPVTGCTKISEGCRNCYAERMSKRIAGRAGYPKDEPFKVTLHEGRLEEPLRWTKPSKIFVCSMGDLFHEDVLGEFILKVFDVMHQCPQHTFQVLTKRPENMNDFISEMVESGLWGEIPGHILLGVTAENQEQADKRIPVLLQIPAAKRFVSVEPMLGPVELNYEFNQWLGEEREVDCGGCSATPVRGQPYCPGHDAGGIDWVICGGESGPGARPMHPDWVRDLRDQCQEAGVPFLFKQWGEWFPRDQWEHNPELVLPDDEFAYHNGAKTHVFKNLNNHFPVHKVGKKKAGRLLDGKVWDEYPEED